MAQRVSYKWKPIPDLPQDYPSLASDELRTLKEIWLEQKDELQATEAVRGFNERLQRQWAIETGVIERVYTLDRGITELLIERGVDASLIPHGATDKNPELVAAMIGDHKEAVEGLFDFVKGERALSTGYIKELHAVLTRHQDTAAGINSLGRRVEIRLVSGEYKSQPNNPSRPDGRIHEYCPPEQVASEMDRLVSLYHEHERKMIPPEIEAAWLHHAFSQIHPFQDGNGRVARTLASLVLIKAGWFPLTITRDHRDDYISALESADHGDLERLVSLFATILKRTFVKALGVAGRVLEQEKVGQVITAARETLERRRAALRREWERAKETADTLQDVAKDRLEDVATRLRSELGSYSREFSFFADANQDSGPRGHYFRYQVIEAARHLEYFANLREYHGWVRLVLRTQEQAEILLSFHGMGYEYRGLLAASVSFFRREQIEKRERQITDVMCVSDEVFQVNYREQLDQARARFTSWFDRALVKALEMWRRGL